MQLVEIPENPIPPNATLRMVQAGPVELRAARWAAVSTGETPSRGTVVLCLGRGEFIEKYAEVVHDLLGRGFAVVAFDWRGQGGSTRLLRNPHKGHVQHFGHYHRDLEAIRTDVLEPHCPKPWFGLAHSMGGAIVVDHAGRQPALFDRIVLSAPMVEICGLPLPRAVRAMAAAATGSGLGTLYVPGGSNRSVMLRRFEGNVLTSDPRRYGILEALVKAAPQLALGAPTHGWLHAAFQTMDPFKEPEFPRRIVTPILVIGCGADRVVETRAIERFATRLKAGRLIVIPHARHEILIEQDRYRDQFWAAFDSFIPGSGPARSHAAPSGAEPRPNMAG